jgi:hypothetical protein
VLTIRISAIIDDKFTKMLQEGFKSVTTLHIFVIRAILAVVFSVVATRMFYGKVDPFYVAGVAVILLGLAYLSEYLRHRKDR